MAWTNLTALLGLNNRVANTDSNSASDFNYVKNAIDEICGNSGSAPSQTITEIIADILDLQTNPSLPPGYITGLEISNGTDTDHEIDIATGRCKDSTGAIDLISTSSITIDIEESGANGLDTGTVANNTWYYIFLIKKDSDGSYAGLLSTNKTSPTIPSGYTYFRRDRGAVLTDGSANILGFYQKDNYFWFNEKIVDVNDTSPGTSRNLATMSTPLNMVGMFAPYVREGGIVHIIVGNPDETDIAPSLTNCDLTTYNNYNVTHKNILVNSSSQIYYRSNNAALVEFYIYTLGFIDNAA